MRLTSHYFTLLLSILSIVLANWIPENALNLGKMAPNSASSMPTCMIRENHFVSVYINFEMSKIDHFSWSEINLDRQIHSFDYEIFQDLVCLREGQYLIVSSQVNVEYENFNFRIFYEDGTLFTTFSFNDTSLNLVNIRVKEMFDGNLLVVPLQPDDTVYLGAFWTLDLEGNVLAHHEIDFEIPEAAHEHNTPSFWTFMKGVPTGENKIILVTSNADWEMDPALSDTAYFPKRNYYHIYILDNQFNIITGPKKVYAQRVGINFDIIPMGTDKFGIVFADRAYSYINSTIYNMNLDLLSSDNSKIDVWQGLQSKSLPTRQDGLVSLTIARQRIYWQQYNQDGSKKGGFVTLNENFRFLSGVEMLDGDDFGLLYEDIRNQNTYLAYGHQFQQVVNSGFVLTISLFLWSILILFV